MAVFNAPVIASAAAAAATGYTIDQSLRFNDDDSAYLSWTPASAGNRKTWTWSGWVKRGNLGTDQTIFQCNGAGATLHIGGNNKIEFYDDVSGAYKYQFVPSQVFRDPAQWIHIVAQLDTSNATSSDRVKLFVNGQRVTAFDTETYPTQNFEGNINTTNAHYIGARGGTTVKYDGYLSEVNFIDGQALTPSDFGETDDTYGHWKAKEYEGTYGTNGFYLSFSNEATKHSLTANGNAQHSTAQSKIGGSSIDIEGGYPNTATYIGVDKPSDFDFGAGDFTVEGWIYYTGASNATHDLFGDTASMYITVDGTNGWDIRGLGADWHSLQSPTANTWEHWAFVRDNGTLRIYKNGAQVASDSNRTTNISYSAIEMAGAGRGYRFRGYIDEFRVSNNCRYPDGSSFTAPTVAFTDDDDTVLLIHSDTTNGSTTFIDDSGVEAGVGNDASGEANHWTPTNLAATDVVGDSPSNNFATFNPLVEGAASEVFTQGNLRVYQGAVQGTSIATIGVSTGKIYWEEYIESGVNNTTGVVSSTEYTDYPGLNADTGIGWYKNGTYYIANDTDSTGHATYTTADVLLFALDVDTGKIWFGKNGTWNEGDPALGTTPAYTLPTGETYYPADRSRSTYSVFNFGQDSSFAGAKTAQSNTDDNGYGDFYYSPPTGYLALCTQNLDDPADGLYADGENQGLAIGLWTGNSGSQTSVSDWPFQADFFWTKVRSNVDAHILRDIVRDGSTTMDASLRSNTTIAEYTSNGTLTANSTGFSVSGHDGGEFNKNNYTYVTWGWKMGGTGSSNTDGSITSTVSANVAAGQSIVSYTGNGTAGATVGHGLSKAPELVIVKQRGGVSNWRVAHKDINLSANSLFLNTTAAEGSEWERVSSLDNQTFTLSSSDPGVSVNGSTETYIAYAWHSVEGYSKIGSYTGNNNADGTFVYTGFRPKWIMVKASSTGGSHYDWAIYDTARSSYNAVGHILEANQSQAEVTGTGRGLPIDIVSNGFKFRSSYAESNSSQTYIYIAFAEYPFKYTNAR